MFPQTFHRTFEVWSYTVGHGQLLLRSVKTDDSPTRIDLGFKDVAYVKLPTVIDIGSVRVGQPEEIRRIGGLVDCSGKTLFVIECGEFEHYIVAGLGSWAEDNKEYFEASAVLPDIGL